MIYINSENEYIKRIIDNKILLYILMEFESSILDKNHFYAFDNWIEGEIIGGPLVGKYHINILLKYPDHLKPDFRALKRLDVYDIKYRYKRVGQYFYNDNQINTSEVSNITGNWVASKFDARKIDQSKKKVYFWLVEFIIPKRLFDSKIFKKSK